MKKQFFIFLISLCSISFAFAASEVEDCPPEFQQATLETANQALADAKLRNAEANAAMNAIDKQAQKQISSCWGALSGMGITGASGLPNLASVIANIVNGIDSACAGAVNGVSSGINSQVGQMTGAMRFTGVPGIPGTNVSPSIYVGGTGQGGFNFMSQGVNAYNNYVPSNSGGAPVNPAPSGGANSVFQTTNAPATPWYSRAVNSIKNAF